MKIPRTLFIVAALLVPLLVVIGSGSGTRAAPPGPTVPYHDSYPITVVAGDYNLVYWVLDFAPGAGIPLHYHGGPTAMLEVAGELTLRAHDGSERTLKPGDTANVAAGDHHVMVNTSTASARLLGVLLLPKGAAGTSIVDTATKMPGPTMPFKGSYPITAVAGEYALVNNVLAFAPGAEVPLHYHGGPAVIVSLEGALTIQASGHAMTLLPGDLDTQAAGAQHRMMNMSAGPSSALFGVLLPKGAQLTTFVPPPAAQAGPRTFPETGQTVQGKFLTYWDKNGGLPQQGYPISAEMQELSATDNKTYTVQYFERAVFEIHPENAPPYDVLLSLLGVSLYNQKYPTGAPDQTPNTQAGSRLFPETGKRVGGVFLDYWTAHGGLAQQGFPISDEFNEASALDPGKTYKVQYFERAVFEFHPENQPPYDVLLAQLGTFRYHAGQLPPTPAPPAVAPTAEPTAVRVQAIPQPPEFAAVRAKFENMTQDQYRAAGYTEFAGCEQTFGRIAVNFGLFQPQLDGGYMDPQNPPMLLVTGNAQRIVGLMWVTNQNAQPPPVLFGQPALLASSNNNHCCYDPVYILIAHFKPNGYVLFADRDPEYTCSAP